MRCSILGTVELELWDSSNRLHIIRSRGTQASCKSNCASAAIRIALAMPTIRAVFSVPALSPCSCEPLTEAV